MILTRTPYGVAAVSDSVPSMFLFQAGKPSGLMSGSCLSVKGCEVLRFCREFWGFEKVSKGSAQPGGTPVAGDRKVSHSQWRLDGFDASRQHK